MKEITAYSDRSIVVPKTTNLHLTDIQQQILSLAINKPSGTSLYKMKAFVGNSMINAYAILKQYLLEIRAREESLENITYTRQKFEIACEVEQEKIDDPTTTPANKKLAELEIARMKHELTKIDRNIQDLYKERDDFIKLAEELSDSQEGILPNGRSLISIMDNSNECEDFEYEHWTIRMAKQAAVDILTQGRIGAGNLESILMMPVEQQAQVYNIANSFAAKLEKQFVLLRNESLQLVQEEQTPVNFVPDLLKISTEKNVSGIPPILLNDNSKKLYIEGETVNVHSL